MRGFEDLEPAPSAAPPSGWVLYAAKASVGVPSGTMTFEGPLSSCSAISSSDDKVVFISNFQQGEIKNLAPWFGYTDRGDGFVVWGLYIGQGGERGEEWSGTGDASPSLTGYEGRVRPRRPRGITFDLQGDGLEPDGRAFLITADWSGTATENFSVEKGAASVSVQCLFVSSEILSILEGAG